MLTFRSLIAPAALALGLAACSGGGGTQATTTGGTCGSLGDNCSTAAHCCMDFVCAEAGLCVFPGGGPSGPTGTGAGPGTATSGSTGHSPSAGTSAGSSNTGAGPTTSGPGGATGFNGSVGTTTGGIGNGSTTGRGTTGGGCVGYGSDCQSASCCNGFACDTATSECLVAVGSSCSGALQCANTASAIHCEAGTGLCAACTQYGGGCGGDVECCGGLTCDVDSHSTCVPGYGQSCAGGLTCAYLLSCDAYSQTCLGAYFASCSTQACGSGFVCTDGYCYVAGGGSCAGNEQCAMGYGCNSATNTCTTCSNVNEGCSTSQPCCSGLALECDATQDVCLIGTYNPCTAQGTCETGSVCDTSVDRCEPEPGGPCGYGGDCAYQSTGAYYCNGTNGLCSPCAAYGTTCDGGQTCCTGLACDWASGTVMEAPGSGCGTSMTCAWAAYGYSCVSGTCQ